MKGTSWITRKDPLMKSPRLYLHPDGKVISIGFDGTQDTLLTLEIGAARYTETDRVRGDMKMLADWVQAIQERIAD